MFLKSTFVTIFITIVFPIFAMINIPTGNFGYFGNCAIKFLRLSDNFIYFDLTEHLIHINNPASLIYTVSGLPNFSNISIQDEKMAGDFKFYEVCTITIFVKFGPEDNQFRRDYIYFTRDGHRGLPFSTFIIISQLPTPNFISFEHRFDYRVPFRTFVVHLKIRGTSRTLYSFLKCNGFLCVPSVNRI